MSLSAEIEEQWAVSFPSLVNELLTPESHLATKYPCLHNNLLTRLECAFAERGDKPISRCTHTNFNGYEAGRCDTASFQESEDTTLLNKVDPIIDSDDPGTRAELLCPHITNRMEIYGLAGTGTFGTVFVARERGQSSDPKHYAIKVEDHTTMLSGFLHNYYSPPMVMVLEESRDLRYIPAEAFVMLLLTSSRRFPNLDSVYIHDRFQAIVMSPCVDWAADLRPIPGAEPYRLFTPFTGKYLMTSDGRPLLDEMEASRVAFQILEGIVEMADLNLWHNDFSINNFIVDRHLNVTIIDLGDVKFGLEDEDFFEDRRCYLPFQEHLMSPELARVLSEQGQFEQNPEDLHDIRQVILWKFGVILFGILHGYWPWDDEQEGQANLLDFGTCEKDIPRVLERRERMMSSPLVLNENLSQDCKDVLRALLDQHPEDRPNLRELTRGFPWFMQWGIVNRIWERPSSEEFYSCSFV